MQLSLEEIKRKEICPILYRKKWDYATPPALNGFLSLCFSEIMRWKCRKGRAISYDVLSSLISFLSVKNNLDKLEVSKIQIALKRFIRSPLYRDSEEILANAEIQLGLDPHVVVQTLPALATDKDRTLIFSWDPESRTLEDIKQKYETRFASVWSFYSLNRYPVFYNFYLKDNEIKHIRYKPNQFYIRDSKAFLVKMKKMISDEGIYPAPLEVCRNCNRRPECKTKDTRVRNYQKSW